MSFHSTQCPSCNRETQVPNDADTSKCMYCGGTIISRATSSPAKSPSVENLLGMARTADIGGNQAEAESYFNRVLELEPTISEAWFGKGKAAGWQSTIFNIRLAEAVTAFNHAISTATTDSKDPTIEACSIEANKIVVALYSLAKKHVTEYVALPNIWQEYINQISLMLDSLETIHSWNPKERLTLENIVHLCKDIIEGISYRDQFDNNTSKAVHLSAEYEGITRLRLEAAASKLKLIDPAYTAPPAVVKKPDACFVVTATMGDFNHPTVTLLRLFRDEWILKQPGGRAFVDWYYRRGPAIASFISKSRALRALSYALIVAPAAQMAKRLIR